MMEKVILVAMSGAGVLFVAIGMWNKNNTLFLLGIGLVIVSYLLIRKKLKGPTQRKH